MTWSLVRKELRDQRPFAWMGAALIVIELFDVLTRQIDRVPLGRLFTGLDGESAAFQVLVAFAVGTGLLMREIDERTLDFLDALPLTRVRLFTIKLVVGVGVLLIYPVGRLLLFVLQHVVSRDSLNRPVHPHLLVIGLLLTALVTFVGLAAGLVFGFLRSLAWLMFGLCAVTLAHGVERWPRLAALNPLELMKIRVVGSRWRLPTEDLWAQLALAVALALSAMALFVSTGRRRNRTLAQWLKRPFFSALVSMATIGVVLWVVTLYARESPQDEITRAIQESPDSVQFPDDPPGHAMTRHYNFSYSAHHSQQLPVLLTGADAVFERVESLLRCRMNAAIDVDLSGSMRNTAGTAFLDRIRMDAGSAELLATLAHETTHVFALRLAGGERESELATMAVFNEGLGRWVESHFSNEKGFADLERLQAAVVSRRHLVNAEMLTDLEALARENDQNLKYPLGFVLVEAFIDRYGSEAPRQLLSNLARPDFPRDLQGISMWQTAFQLSGFDLAITLDDYSSRLKSWELEYAHVIDGLPRPRGALVRRKGRVGVEVRFDEPMPEQWAAVVRFRPTNESPLHMYHTRGVVGGVAWYFRDRLANEEVCFQPGLVAGNVTIFEPWNCLSLDSAGDLSQTGEPDR